MLWCPLRLLCNLRPRYFSDIFYAICVRNHCWLLASVFCRDNFIQKQPMLLFYTQNDTKQAKSPCCGVRSDFYAICGRDIFLTFSMQFASGIIVGCSPLCFVVTISSKNNLCCYFTLKTTPNKQKAHVVVSAQTSMQFAAEIFF